MFAPDDFPGADHIPWRYLIRAKYQYEIDAVVASSIVHKLGAVVSADVATKIAQVAAEAVARDVDEPVEVDGAQRLAFLDALADWDGDLCPPWWPWPIPGPRPHPWLDQFGDPIAIVAIGRALDLVNVAGSRKLQGMLGEALKELRG